MRRQKASGKTDSFYELCIVSSRGQLEEPEARGMRDEPDLEKPEPNNIMTSKVARNVVNRTARPPGLQLQTGSFFGNGGNGPKRGAEI
jgi:hypothetical protein